MIRDRFNIIPVCMSVLLHALAIASMLVVFDFSRPVTAAQPLAIEATLVTEELISRAPPPVREPEPEPEPVVETSEQERIEAEERMRQEELAREQQRIREQEEAEQQRRQKEAEERRKREEAEKERKRQEAERKRQEEIERQRLENERLRKEALEREAADLRAAEIAAEEARLARMSSTAMAQWQFAIQQKVMRSWTRPASATPGIECVVDVRIARGGEVLSARVGRCNGDDAVRRSIEAAVFKAVPLPSPSDPNIFDPNLRFIFKPEE